MMLIVAGALGQTQDSYDYGSEFTWGINKNTSGGLIGGLVFKKAHKLNDRVLETFGLEIMNVKHPQERRTNSVQTGNLFIYGKSNYLYAIRLQYGRDIILFKKAPHQGVEIKGVFALGPTIGIVAPYYVEYYPENGSGGVTVRAPYNPSININYIAGTGRLFEGLSDSKIKPGLNFKAAMNFELGTIKSQVTGFEAGFLLDAYSGTVEMMPGTKNYSMYPTLFLTLFYGSRK
ncbi:hypothetical protein [Chryseolinea lacunae]|uniref:Outer membrane protein beta-barrel domain-containing protein n=1 Tax=Chryseolinea lacunae TaxID=2801331 RepID=A0ABS1KQ00_9BACT|nr:hypothetical protein [Chryseolinea lacunae]MBL0741540.1 hypothetical protein [Chryseolinea lacunae]